MYSLSSHLKGLEFMSQFTLVPLYRS